MPALPNTCRLALMDEPPVLREAVMAAGHWLSALDTAENLSTCVPASYAHRRVLLSLLSPRHRLPNTLLESNRWAQIRQRRAGLHLARQIVLQSSVNLQVPYGT